MENNPEKDYRIQDIALAEIMAHAEDPYRKRALAKCAIGKFDEAEELSREASIISNIEARIYLRGILDTISYHDILAERRTLFSVTLDEFKEFGNKHGYHPNTTSRTLRYLLNRCTHEERLPETKKTISKVMNEAEKIIIFHFFKSPSENFNKYINVPAYGDTNRKFLEDLETFMLSQPASE